MHRHKLTNMKFSHKERATFILFYSFRARFIPSHHIFSRKYSQFCEFFQCLSWQQNLSKHYYSVKTFKSRVFLVRFIYTFASDVRVWWHDVYINISTFCTFWAFHEMYESSSFFSETSIHTMCEHNENYSHVTRIVTRTFFFRLHSSQDTFFVSFSLCV